MIVSEMITELTAAKISLAKVMVYFSKFVNEYEAGAVPKEEKLVYEISGQILAISQTEKNILALLLPQQPNKPVGADGPSSGFTQGKI